MDQPKFSMRRIALETLFLAVLAGVAVGAAEPARPNIVLILIDDQGYYDLACYGASEVRTPRIDGLAAAGVRFTDYYAAAPICSPSRAGLLTGCYPRRVGLETWVQRADSRRGIHPDELTLAELLQAGGYSTGCIGKWHLGFAPPFLPRRQGFDYYFGLLHNLDPVEIGYFADAGGTPLMRNEDVIERAPDPGTLTARYTDEAIAFLERNQTRPFFLYLAHTMLHEPLGAGPAFAGTSRWGLYGDAIQELDFQVGRLLDALQRLKLERNTIVLYASDNGRGPGRNPQQPLRGYKLTTYEAGIRVPCIAWGPGLGIRAGHVSSALVYAMDWYPTLATFAKTKLPPGRVTDGRDLYALLRGETDDVTMPNGGSLNADAILARGWTPPGEWAGIVTRDEYWRAFFYHGAEGQLAAVRSGKWKLVLTPGQQLFNLESDPGETKPVQNREVSRKLLGMAVMFQDEMRRDRRPIGDLNASNLR